MRSIRRFTQLVLTALGAATVGYAIFGVEGLYFQALVAALGLIIMELGIWQITRAFFPNERRFLPLRKETRYFLQLVSRLNRAVLKAEKGDAAAREEVDRLQSEMHHSVDRMRNLAGLTDADFGIGAIPAAAIQSGLPESAVR